jgi:hypothetical protein
MNRLLTVKIPNEPFNALVRARKAGKRIGDVIRSTAERMTLPGRFAVCALHQVD